MKSPSAIGMGAGGAVVLGGLLLLAWERLGRPDAAPARIWNLYRWLGLVLPVPDDPRLLAPTLAWLGMPLWFTACVLGVIVIAAFGLVRAVR